MKRTAFNVLQGSLHRYKTETNAWRGFCQQCGTSISYESPKRPDEIDITTGTLDDPNQFPPKWDAFGEEKLTWVNKVSEQ